MKRLVSDYIEVPITVIIPVWNEQKRVVECIEGLFQDDWIPQEVIVIDNGSSDNTVSAVKGYFNYLETQGVKSRLLLLIADEVKSSYYARNVGVREASHETILFIDADCKPQEHFTYTLAEHVGTKRPVIGGMTFLYEGDLYEKGMVIREEEQFYKRTAVVIVPKILCALHPFNEQETSGEDFRFLSRFDCVMDEAIKVTHPWSIRGQLYRNARYSSGIAQTRWQVAVTYIALILIVPISTLVQLVNRLLHVQASGDVAYYLSNPLYYLALKWACAYGVTMRALNKKLR